MATINLILQISFALVIFFVLYGIFRVVKRGTNPLRKWYFWLSLGIVIPLLYFLTVVMFINYSFPLKAAVEFNREQWIENKEVRVLMIDNLIGAQLLDGKSKDEVFALLGKPEEDSPYFQYTDREVIYYLGRERGVTGVDSEWLLIWFNDEEVLKYQVVKD